MRSKKLLRLIPVVAIPAVLLAGCQMKIGKDEQEGNSASVSVGDDGNVQVSAADGARGVSISVPGFSAKVNVPGLELGGDDMDIDGMKLYPGTKLANVNVNGGDHSGTVDMKFNAPGAPTAIADYYVNAAREKAFTEVASRKDGDRMIVTGEETRRRSSDDRDRPIGCRLDRADEDRGREEVGRIAITTVILTKVRIQRRNSAMELGGRVSGS